MTHPGPAHGQPADAEGLQARVDAIRTQVRRDPRATSFPLLLLGTATVVGELPQVLGQGRDTDVPAGGGLFTALLLTAAFAVLWRTHRRHELRDGVGHPEGLGALGRELASMQALMQRLDSVISAHGD